jgi:hypothetical protein
MQYRRVATEVKNPQSARHSGLWEVKRVDGNVGFTTSEGENGLVTELEEEKEEEEEEKEEEEEESNCLRNIFFTS